MRSSEANFLLFKEFCKERNKWKSDGARSGLYSGCGNTFQKATIFADLPFDNDISALNLTELFSCSSCFFFGLIKQSNANMLLKTQLQLQAQNSTELRQFFLGKKCQQ